MTDWLHKQDLQRKILRGGQWFYWIPLLAIINGILNLIKIDFPLIFECLFINVGLGALNFNTQNAPKELVKIETITAVEWLFFSMVICCAFFIIGKQASKRKRWAFIVGMTLYTLDATLCFFGEDYMACLFHIFVLYSIYTGYKALQKYTKLNINEDADTN